MADVVIQQKGQTDVITPLAISLGVGAMGFGLWYFLRKDDEGIPQSLSIDKYTNLTTGLSADYPKVLDVRDGDLVQVFFSYSYKGPAIDGKYHLAWAQNHDELSSVEKPFSVPESPDSDVVKDSIILKNEGLAPKLYGIYFKILGIPGKDYDIWVQNIINAIGETTSFSFSGFIVTPHEAVEGSTFVIKASITNITQTEQNGILRLLVREGAAIGTGDVLDTWETTFILQPGETGNATFQHTGMPSEPGSNPQEDRDVEVQVLVGGAVVDSIIYYDAFVVLHEAETFSIGTPVASRYSPNYQGDVITITVPVTNHGISTQNVVVDLIIYQGALIGSGQIVPGGVKTKSVSIGAGQTNNVVFSHTCTDLGGDATRDVDVDVTLDGVQVAHLEKDDIFRVESGGGTVSLVIGTPTVTPYQANEGSVFTIKVPITNNGSGYEQGTVVIYIKEGAAVGSGDVLDTQEMPLLFPGNSTQVATFYHIGMASEPGDNPQEDRDIDIDLIVNGVVVAERDIDTFFRVLHSTTPPPPVEYGAFGVGLENITGSPQWIAEWETAEGSYISQVTEYFGVAIIPGPSGPGTVPLTGKFYAHYWAPAYGIYATFGPSQTYTLVDGALYRFDPATLLLRPA